MTVIAAYNDGKRHWIASDSMGSRGDTMYELGSKLIIKGNYIIGFSWSYRVADIIRESKNLPKELSSIKDLRTIRDVIKETLINDNLIGNNDNAKPEGHPLDIILVSPAGIYTVETDYQIHKVLDNYITCGSGTEVAMGVLYTCNELKIEGKKAVKLAVEASIKHIASVGGKCYIKSVEKK